MFRLRGIEIPQIILISIGKLAEILLQQIP